MVLAALACFALLLIAWIAAPAEAQPTATPVPSDVPALAEAARPI